MSLPVRVLKDIIDILCPKLVIDFDIMIETGVFPQGPKLADVIPIFKAGIKQFEKKFRPVSLLSAISKIFERLMLYQMHEYMVPLLSIFLCGFTECPELPPFHSREVEEGS